MNCAPRNASMRRADGNLMQIGDDIAGGKNACDRRLLLFVDHDASRAAALDPQIANQTGMYFAAKGRIQNVKFQPMASLGLSSNSVAAQLEANGRFFYNDASLGQRFPETGRTCSVCRQDRNV